MKKFFIILSAIILAVAVAMMIKVSQFYNKIQTSAQSPNAQKVAPEDKKTYNILLMGYGGANHDGTYLTDTMMVLHMDMKAKRVLLVSIPRDIWVKVPTKSGDDFHAKINAVYQMALFNKNYPDLDVKNDDDQSAADFAKQAVTTVTGMPIDNYIAIDFTGFKKSVDILGGVDVQVEKSFDDYEYPIDGKEKDLCGKQESDLPELEKIATQDAVLAFPCRYEHLHFDMGQRHMDGETALKYVRSRHSLQDGTDFGRAARQQRFLEAMKDKVISFGFLPKVIPLMDELKDYIKMDISLGDMQKLLGEAGKSKEYKISSLVISNSNYLKNSYSTAGGFILVPQDGIDEWGDVRNRIHNEMLGITPTPTKVASSSGSLRQ